jgi:hypothetical protein
MLRVWETRIVTRRTMTKIDGRTAAREEGAAAVARAASDLARLGVAESVRDELAARLAVLARTLSPEAYDAAVAGAVLAHAVHRESEQVLRRSVRDLGEIQRLVGAFSEEMGKLDEALQILTTYVKRMRARARPTERPRLLH